MTSPVDVQDAPGDAAVRTSPHPWLPETAGTAGIAAASRWNGAEAPSHALTRIEVLGLVGLTLLATALRLWGLAEWSLWVDEAHTFRDATVEPAVFWDSGVGRYPLSFLLLRGLIDVMPSTGEGWLRLPFVFFGILSVPTLALVGRGIVGARAAFLAALLLALFPWHVYWSQNVRSYSMMTFFALCAGGAWFHATTRRSVWTFGLALLALAASGLSHPTGFLLGAGLIGVWILDQRQRAFRRGGVLRKWWPLCLAVVVLVLSLWVVPFLLHVVKAKPDFSPRHLIATLVFFVGPGMLCAAGGGLCVLATCAVRPARLLGAWMLVPPAVLLALSATLTETTAQYAFCTLPAVCLCAAVFAVRVHDALPGRSVARLLLRAALPAVLLADLVGYDYLYFTKQYGDRPRWREAAQLVLAHPEPRKFVLTTNGPSTDYYLRRGRFFGETVDEPPVVSWETWFIRHAGGPVELLEQYRAEAAAEERAFFVMATEPVLFEKDPTGLADHWLRQNGHQIGRFSAWTGPKDMTILVYLVPPPPR
jgi:hypothetical protein